MSKDFPAKHLEHRFLEKGAENECFFRGRKGREGPKRKAFYANLHELTPIFNHGWTRMNTDFLQVEAEKAEKTEAFYTNFTNLREFLTVDLLSHRATARQVKTDWGDFYRKERKERIEKQGLRIQQKETKQTKRKITHLRFEISKRIFNRRGFKEHKEFATLFQLPGAGGEVGEKAGVAQDLELLADFVADVTVDA
jgi:hypothetical protein